jgi:hypothetical protein
MSIKPFVSLVPSIGMQHLAGQGMLTKGQAWFVAPYSGSDTADGRRPDRALKTLSKALSKATADRNDVVYMFAESNTAAYTTDYQTAMLDWNKDGVHLIGVNCGASIGQRSRVAWKSTTSTATATELFKLSADNCLIANVGFFQGLASATSMLGCMNVTGTRNKVFNCHISGMGHADNVIANAYSLALTGAAENLFERCTIGLDTIPRATNTTSEIRVLTAATRNEFKDCKIVSQIGHATYSPYVYFVGATAIDRWILFDNCKFMNFATNYGFTQTYAMAHSATPTQGAVIINGGICMATYWANTGNHVYLSAPPVNTAYTGGSGYVA